MSPDDAYDAGWAAALDRSDAVGPGLAEATPPPQPLWVHTHELLDDWWDGYGDGIHEAATTCKTNQRKEAS